MNLIPHYITISKIIRRLSRISNNLYRLIPIRLFFKIKTRKWIRDYDKNTVKNNLNNSLGDFLQYDGFCVDKDDIIKAAEDVLEHKFDLLGSGPVKLDPIDWHIDFKSGFRWPKGKFYKDYVQVDLSNNADVKVPRELSRSHHLLWIGQAYLLTKDEKYTKEFISQINSWIKENPLMRSINWGCAMDVAIRAVNWLYALNMFIESKLITEHFIKKIVLSFYQHAWFIFNNLEKGFPGSHNHYMSDLVGLLFLGRLFKTTRDGKRWFSFALNEFYFELRYQILPNGPSYERSTHYHRLMTELVFYSYLFLKRININPPFDIRQRVFNMLDFVLHYTKPDGFAPIIGDEDNGRLLPIVKYTMSDHRYLLCLGAIEFKDEIFKKHSSGYVLDSFFLFGNASNHVFENIPATEKSLSSKSFMDAGQCIIRHNNWYLFINNSGAAKYPDHSTTGGSHAHADLLSFVLAIGNTTFLVDPGTYVYSASRHDRNLFRSTRMHNTLVVDHQDQHFLPDNQIFAVKDIGCPTDFQFSESETEITFRGAHDGYKKLNKPVIHERVFALNKGDNQLIITDRLKGDGAHSLKWFFHFNNDIELNLFNNNTLVANDTAHNESITVSFNAKFDFELSIIDSSISKSYGAKQASKSLMVKAFTKCPCSFNTYITPSTIS